MIRLRPFAVALACLLGVASGPAAHAQTAPPAPLPCSPTCSPTESCVDGRCVMTQDPRAPEVAAPVPAPMAEPPAPAPQPQPQPARHRAPPRRAEPEETNDTDEDELPARRRGVLVLPFLGIHVVQGIASDDYDVGGRGGLLLGVHLVPKVSLNVEVALDLLNPQAGDPSVSVQAHDLTIAFSPLFHAGGRKGELVVGPKLGFWSDNFTITVNRETRRASQSGWAFGFNVGAFTAVSDDVSIGLLASYQFIAAVQSCTHGPLDDQRACAVADAFPPEILGLTGAALF